MFEDEDGGALVERLQQQLADARRERVARPGRFSAAVGRLAAAVRAVLLRQPGQQAGQQHFGQLHRPRVGQHRLLHQMDDRQQQRHHRQVDGQVEGAG